MKILLLSQFYSDTRGGGEYVFSMIAKQLADNGHKVWILTNRVKDESYRAHVNIKLVFIPPDLEYTGGLPPSFSENLRYFFNAVRKGKELVKKENIDIIHSNNFSPALAGGFLSLLTSKPHITSVWDIFTLCGKNYWKEWVKQKNISKIHGILGASFEKLILKVPCKAIYTISEATYDDLKKFGAKKPIYVIFPSIHMVDVIQSQQNSLQFIYIGRLVFYKNLEVVIKAIDLVRKTEQKVELVIVGGGPHEKTIRDLINELNLESNVKLTGYLSSKEKYELLSQSNALLFPSLCEGFGLVVLEAFSQNKPVLVSNIRPMSDTVSHNKNGYVLDPHNESEWAMKILELIKNPEISLKMGMAGRQILENEYGYQKMYEKMIQMYESFL